MDDDFKDIFFLVSFMSYFTSRWRLDGVVGFERASAHTSMHGRVLYGDENPLESCVLRGAPHEARGKMRERCRSSGRNR